MSVTERLYAEYGLSAGTRIGPDPSGDSLSPVTTEAGRKVIAGFKTRPPSRIDGPSVWYGKGPDGMEAHPERWSRRVTAEEIAEVEAAVESVLASGKDLAKLSKEDFPLPTLSASLASISRTLHEGYGFYKLHGFPVARWTREQRAVAFLGLGSHVGDKVPQNKKGHVLGHVKDLKVDPSAPQTRRYMTNARQTFHADESDVVGLMCLETAPEGGESMLASAATVYNELVKRHPDLVPVLFAPWLWDRKNEEREGQKPYFAAPVYTWHAGRIISFYISYFASTTYRHGVPPLTAEQRAAMTALEEICEEVALGMHLGQGDVQFVHNHSIFHDRLAWRDSETQVCVLF